MKRSFIKSHTGFELDNDFECEVDKKIREFAGFVSENIPTHISCFIVTVTKTGYSTQAIENNPVCFNNFGEVSNEQ